MVMCQSPKSENQSKGRIIEEIVYKIEYLVQDRLCAVLSYAPALALRYCQSGSKSQEDIALALGSSLDGCIGSSRNRRNPSCGDP